jgi:hypothetical protein
MRSGPHPSFYQSYFEPAVMTACGKGFGVTQSRPMAPALRAFLLEQADRFSCSDLPADLVVGTTGLYQGPWRYLMTSVAVAWMVVGISWSGLAPLFGVLFGLTTAVVFALCRLVVGRAAAIVCAALMCVSPVQLANLPNLRDYAKAPFTLALIAILLALVVRPLQRRYVLALAACYGIVLGIGYGFRTDLLVDIPPFLIAVALFLPGGVVVNLPLKAAAVTLCVATFIIAAWPIIHAVTSGGGCQWHFFLLGLSDPFNAALGVRGGAYSWGHFYRDEYLWATVANFAGRARPDLGYIDYCAPAYGRRQLGIPAPDPGDISGGHGDARLRDRRPYFGTAVRASWFAACDWPGRCRAGRDADECGEHAAGAVRRIRDAVFWRPSGDSVSAATFLRF